jgi:hypothetical protein
MEEYESDVPKNVNRDFTSEINYKIDHANALRGKYDDSGTLARIAIREIVGLRKEAMGEGSALPAHTAYVIRQLKRPEEVVLLRRIYGRQFILISAYGSVEDRRKIIFKKLKGTRSSSARTSFAPSTREAASNSWFSQPKCLDRGPGDTRLTWRAPIAAQPFGLSIK